MELDQALVTTPEMIAKAAATDDNQAGVVSTPTSNTNNIGTMTAEEAILDSMGGTIWRMAYLRMEDLTEDHVLQIAK